MTHQITPPSSELTATRRQFLALGTGLCLAPSFLRGAESERRAGIIGHTGRGNYGHGLDIVWQRIPNTKIVGVADANEGGLSTTLKRLDVDCGFADYRKMLAESKPEFVSVCPRHPDQHHDMALAAIEAGVKGIYIEKPFVRTPAEADSLLTACKKHGAKIAVAHRNRYHPALEHIRKAVDEGRIGRLLELRGRGKDDHRGGDEDLWVLGSHVINLMTYFAGPVRNCAARFLRDGRPVEPANVYAGREALGPLAANEVHIRWETESGVPAFYDSVKDGQTKVAFGLHLIGSDGVIAIHPDKDPVAHLRTGSPFAPTSTTTEWIPISSAGIGQPEENKQLILDVHTHVAGIRDLIEACDTDRQPLCSAADGATTIEMIASAFESHQRQGAVVPLPLQSRQHPWSDYVTTNL